MKTVIIYLLFGFCLFRAFAQKKHYTFLDIDSFYGMAIEHDKSLATAIQGNPYGILIGFNLKNAKESDWLAYYNYPDFGFSALYQNTNSTILGKMYALYTHYNFYFKNRNAQNKLQLRVAFGLGYITNPYNAVTNAFNYSLATKFAGSAYLKLNYQRDFFKGRLGFQTGIALIHFSNAGFKNPNLGLNTIAATVGLNYNLQNENPTFSKKQKQPKDRKKIKFNFIFRTGLNESKIPNSGQFPFYVGTFALEKKLHFKSTITAGADYFKSEFLNNYFQDEIEVQTGIPNTTNFKTDRIGIFVGHDLYVHNFSVVTQLGYHIYAPNVYVSRLYERLGFKHRFNKHIFTELTLKVNLFRAEGLEFGIGYRL